MAPYDETSTNPFVVASNESLFFSTLNKLYLTRKHFISVIVLFCFDLKLFSGDFIAKSPREEKERKKVYPWKETKK